MSDELNILNESFCYLYSLKEKETMADSGTQDGSGKKKNKRKRRKPAPDTKKEVKDLPFNPWCQSQALGIISIMEHLNL